MHNCGKNIELDERIAIIAFTLNVEHHKPELECNGANQCLMQLHQGTKVKAHQPTVCVHNPKCAMFT